MQSNDVISINNSTKSKGISKMTIVGIVIGIIIAILIITALIFIILRERLKKPKEKSIKEDSSKSTFTGAKSLTKSQYEESIGDESDLNFWL